jgi:glycerophosphoryl diester phosphodiesterase
VSLELLGHRGAAAERPENTLESFARALALGVDILETDAHMTADGHLVLSHDATGARMCGVRRAIGEIALAEVQRWDAGWGFVDGRGERPYAGAGLVIPSLADLLDAFPGVRLNIDLKQRAPSMVGPLLELLRARGAEDRATLASFHGPVIREVRARGFGGRTVLAGDEVRALLLCPERMWRALGGGGAVVQVPPRTGAIDLSGRFLDKCHALGLRVDYWVVNDPAEAEALLARGADGLITDDPAAILPVIERHRQRLSSSASSSSVRST